MYEPFAEMDTLRGKMIDVLVDLADADSLGAMSNDALDDVIVSSFIVRVKLAKKLVIFKEGWPFDDVVSTMGKKLEGAK